jgi:hypothetical protein
MTIPTDAAELLNREFLEIRARLLQVAAALDRLDRAEGDVSQDKRRRGIDEAIGVLASRDEGRAEKLQMIFSLPYERKWKEKFKMTNGEARMTNE